MICWARHSMSMGRLLALIAIRMECVVSAAQTEARPASVRSARLWRAAPRATIETVLIVAGLLVQWLYLPFHLGPDAQDRYQALTQLLSSGTISTSRYSMIGPIFSAPLWELGRLAKGSVWWVERYNFLLFVAALAAIWILLRNRMDRDILRLFLLLLVAASMFPNHISNYYGEVFTSLCVCVGVIAVATGKGRWGWPLMVVGVANTPATLLGVAAVALVWALVTKRLRYLLAPVAAYALIAAEAWIRLGSPFTNGYNGDHGFATVMPYSGKPGFSYPIYFGVLALLFSFGKGLLFYAPGLFLPVRRRLAAVRERTAFNAPALYGAWLAFVVGLLLVYGHWWAWYGGNFWGPRFLLFASIPASFALALRLRSEAASPLSNAVTLVIDLLSSWVALNGAVFDQPALSPICRANQYALETLCHNTLEFSALWRPFVVPAQVTHHDWALIGYFTVVALWVASPVAAALARQIRAGVRGVLGSGGWRL